MVGTTIFKGSLRQRRPSLANPRFSLPTMATTTGNDWIPFTVHAAGSSPWQRFKESAVDRWYGSSLGSFVTNLGCCFTAGEFEELRMDQEMRKRVRKHMTRQELILYDVHDGDASGLACRVDPAPLLPTLVATVREDEYVIGGLHTIRMANVGVRRTEREWDEYFAQLNVVVAANDPSNESVIEMPERELWRVAGKARLIPRFVAGVVFVLRSRLVSRKRTEDNILVVTREYQKICKVHGVHRCDMDRHLQHVLNCYFTEDCTTRLGTSRRRAPGWAKRLLGIGDATSDVSVC